MHLLERQEQLEQLDRCFQQARAASGKLVFISGEAGVGKSSLVERFVSDHRRDARTLWGACDALSTPRALAPVYEIAAQTSVLTGRGIRDDRTRDCGCAGGRALGRCGYARFFAIYRTACAADECARPRHVSRR